jgi:hypothetical protein
MFDTDPQRATQLEGSDITPAVQLAFIAGASDHWQFRIDQWRRYRNFKNLKTTKFRGEASFGRPADSYIMDAAGVPQRK